MFRMRYFPIIASAPNFYKIACDFFYIFLYITTVSSNFILAIVHMWRVFVEDAVFLIDFPDFDLTPVTILPALSIWYIYPTYILRISTGDPSGVFTLFFIITLLVFPWVKYMT